MSQITLNINYILGFIIIFLFQIIFCQDFQTVYKTYTTQCNITVGPLIGINCPNNIQVHKLSSLLSGGSSPFYYNYYQNQTISSYIQSNGFFDNSNKLTYVANEKMFVTKIDQTKNVISVYQNETFTMSKLKIAFQDDIVGISLDSDEKFVYIRDVKKNVTLPSIIFIKGDKLIFSITKRLNQSDPNYDLIVCNYKVNENGTCQLYEILTQEIPNIQFTLKRVIDLTNQCIENVRMTSQYLIIGCSQWNNKAGKLQIYQRTISTQALTLIDSEIGSGGTSGKQYTNVGDQIDIQYHNANHSTVYYTSQYETKLQNNTSINITYINTIQFFALEQNGVKLYKNLTTINQFRQKTNDGLIKGRLQFGVNNRQLLASYYNLDKLYYMPVCLFNESINSQQTCTNCPVDTFAQEFNSQFCSSCYDSYPSSSLQQILKLIYCKNQPAYTYSNYPYNNQKIILPVQLYQNEQDQPGNNQQIDDFIPYPDGYVPPDPTVTPPPQQNNDTQQNQTNNNNTNQQNQTNGNQNQTNNQTDPNQNQNDTQQNNNTQQNQTQNDTNNQNSQNNNTNQQQNNSQNQNDTSNPNTNLDQQFYETHQQKQDELDESILITIIVISILVFLCILVITTIIICRIVKKNKRKELYKTKEQDSIKAPGSSVNSQQNTLKQAEISYKKVNEENESKIIVKNLRTKEENQNFSLVNNKNDNKKIVKFNDDYQNKSLGSIFKKVSLQKTPSTGSKHIEDQETSRRLNDIELQLTFDNIIENNQSIKEIEEISDLQEISGIIFKEQFDPDIEDLDVLENRMKCYVCDEAIIKGKDIVRIDSWCSHQSSKNAHRLCFESLKSSPCKKNECYKCSNTQSGPHIITQSTPSSIDLD